MKRVLSFISAIAVLVLAAGCNKQASVNPQDDVITASFTVSLPSGIATKAISDGSQADELIFQAYDANLNHLDALDQTVAVSGKKATVNVTLVRGVSYTFVFWAQKQGKYAVSYDSNGHPVIEIKANDLPAMMNDDSYDAFYATVALGPQDGDVQQDITLKRPFAQINLGISADDAQVATDNALNLADDLKTSFTIKGVNNSIDLLTGAASGNNDVVYTAAVAPADTIVSEQVTYRRIGMVYVLAGTSQSVVDLTAAIQTKQSGSIDVNFTRAVPNVPVVRNYRTNIVGKVFSIGGTFNIQVDADFATPDSQVDL